jgi:hypothetical protein
MRCPKCSFISFDIVESCAKCGKNISKAAEELMGTVADVVPPHFLRFEAQEPVPETETMSDAVGEEVSVDVGGEEQEEVEFALDEAEPEAEAVDFETGDEAPVEEEPEIDLAAEGGEADEPLIDLAGEEPREEAIDISDLAPTEETVEPFVEGESVFEEDVGVEEPVSQPDQAGELEDLEVVGIDLESKPAAGGKVMPSVKTGTALDDFDIDLGDLIPGKKED